MAKTTEQVLTAAAKKAGVGVPISKGAAGGDGRGRALAGPARGGAEMRRAVKLVALAVAVCAVAIDGGRARLKRARAAYGEAIASGSKPVEGVGTAVAAFIGLAPGGPVNTP